MRVPTTEARQELIESNIPLVHHVVGRFFPSRTDREDLFQIGCIGLIKAIDRFDASLGVRFSTYAVPLILGEIRCFLRDNSPIKINRDARTLARRASEKEYELLSSLGRMPSLGEVAAELGVDRSELAAAIEAASTPLSLQAKDDPDGSEFEELAATKHGNESVQQWQDMAELRVMLDRLPQQHRVVLEMRFFHDRTQTEIAKELGLSQAKVCRVEKKALMELRSLLTP